MKKSEVAFRMSAERLFTQSKRVYFWTFTFVEVLADWEYSHQWARFWKRFQDESNYFIGGLKVAEMHRSHGLHYHCLLNQRISVNQVRRIGAKFGIGRVGVCRADIGAVGYLSKYLSKGFKDELYPGLRRWSPLGYFKGVRVRDIEVESDFTDKLRSVKGPRRITWTGYQLARREYIRTGRVSPATVVNNLFKADINAFDRMQAESMLIKQRDCEIADGEFEGQYQEWLEEPQKDYVTGYAYREIRGRKAVEIVTVMASGERGNVVGKVDNKASALRMCAYLNERRETSYCD